MPPSVISHYREASCRALFEHSRDAIFFVDENGRFTDANPAAEKLCGYSLAELTQMTFLELTVPEWREQTKASFQATMQGESSDTETVLLCKSGAHIRLTISGGPVLHEGKIVGVFGIAREEAAQKMNKLAMRESEAPFHELADAMPQIAWMARPDGYLDYFNKRWYEFTGFNPGEGGDESWMPALHPDDLERCVNTWYAAVRSGRPYEMELRLLEKKTGNFRWHIARALPVRDAEGEIVRWFGTCTDFDDQKRTEQALARSEEGLRFAHKCANAAAWDWDLVRDELTWSQECLELYGLENAAFHSTYEGWIALVHPDDRARVERSVRAVIARRRAEFRVEYRILHPRKGLCWLTAIGKVQVNESGQAIRLSGLNLDITERKQTEEQLQSIVTLAPCILWVAGIHGREGWQHSGDADSYFEWDMHVQDEQAAQNVLPLDADESYMHAWYLSRFAEDQPLMNRNANRALTRGDSGYTNEFRCRDKFGETRWMLEEVTLQQFAPGHWRGIGVVTNITQRKNAELESQRAQREAEAANAAKDRFLAVLSHELRTPLNPVLMTVSALVEEAGLSPRLREDLEMIRRNTELEARLIDDLLDLTAINKGKLRLDLQNVDAHALLRQALQIIESDARIKTISITTDLQAPEHSVNGDPARLQQVFWNVIKNAIKFTPDHGAVMIWSRNEAGNLTVAIEDNGIGIEPEALPKIFTAFEQGDDSITRLFGGLGMGLTISKALLEIHGGSISAKSDGAGHGTTVTITLPVIAAAEIRATATKATPPLPNRLRILVVEDHESTAQVMCRLLRRLGHEVETAGGVRSAIELVDKMEFDLLISDLGLPDGTGLDVMRYVKQAKNMRGIALSGFGMEEDLRRSREAGFAAHLTKPIDFDKLKAVIENFGATMGTAN